MLINMKFRVCICCGEPMSAEGNNLSRNPNVCASCSSIVDGEGEASKGNVSEIRAEGRAARVKKSGQVRKAA